MEDPQSNSRSTGWSKIVLGVLGALLLLVTGLWLGVARLPHKVGSFASVSGGSRMTRLEPNDPTATFRMKITDTRTGQTWDEAWSVGQVDAALKVEPGGCAR